MKSNRASLLGQCPAPYCHTAAVPLTDFWHRVAAPRTQNPSQGADACFLLTYAPEKERGGWEMEGKAGNIRSREQEEGGVNLKEQ
ncbi:Myelin basic protein [Dissostichus eleginoides]|uniref:Myelin basic protein n=1 Tax=Dissostichus eleginoides TaxID=100907 RepID=A0AAD9B8H5_DISEL|nr:Myelin basic protein [Dissostichus eleginoides]